MTRYNDQKAKPQSQSLTIDSMIAHIAAVATTDDVQAIIDYLNKNIVNSFDVAQLSIEEAIRYNLILYAHNQRLALKHDSVDRLQTRFDQNKSTLSEGGSYLRAIVESEAPGASESREISDLALFQTFIAVIDTYYTSLVHRGQVDCQRYYRALSRHYQNLAMEQQNHFVKLVDALGFNSNQLSLRNSSENESSVNSTNDLPMQKNYSVNDSSEDIDQDSSLQQAIHCLDRKSEQLRHKKALTKSKLLDRLVLQLSIVQQLAVGVSAKEQLSKQIVQFIETNRDQFDDKRHPHLDRILSFVCQLLDAITCRCLPRFAFFKRHLNNHTDTLVKVNTVETQLNKISCN